MRKIIEFLKTNKSLGEGAIEAELWNQARGKETSELLGIFFIVTLTTKLVYDKSAFPIQKS